MTDRLHIALTFDDLFWAPAYATMRSICLASRRTKDIVFHLVHWRLERSHRAELDAIAREFGATLVDHPLEDDAGIAATLERLPYGRGFAPIVYARLFLTHFVPAEAGRFLYLDTDLYVRAPVERLFALDLDGNAIAAASEPGRARLLRGPDMAENGKPFASSDRYFNSGVLVIDRAAWAAADLPGQLAEHVRTGLIDVLYHEQDILNLAFRDRWLELEPRWNLTKPSPALRSLDPYIVHYTTGMKPWNRLSWVAFGSSYKDVMTRAVLGRYRRHRRRVWMERLISRGRVRRPS